MRSVKTYAKFKAALSSPVSGDGWISVKERLPEDEKHVLIAGNKTIYVGYHFYKEWCDLRGRTVTVTHWQPLPAPPSVSGGTNDKEI